MKFSEYKIKADRFAFKYAKPGIMLTVTEKPCLQCGTITPFVEVFSESHFCSDECVDEFYKENCRE